MGFVTRPRLGCFEPNADVFVDDEGGQLVVTVEVAGADPDSLRIELDARHLSIFGRREPGRSRSGSFVQKEIASGEFAKRIHLPVPVDEEGATASYSDGVLIVTLTVAQVAYTPTTRTEIRMIVTRITR